MLHIEGGVERAPGTVGLMRRRLFHFVTLISLGLCALFTIMRFRVMVAQDSIAWARAGGRCVVVQTAEDNLEILVARDWPESWPVTWRRTAPGHRSGDRDGRWPK